MSQLKLTSDGQHLLVSNLDRDFTLRLYRTLDLEQVDQNSMLGTLEPDLSKQLEEDKTLSND